MATPAAVTAAAILVPTIIFSCSCVKRGSSSGGDVGPKFGGVGVGVAAGEGVGV